MNATAARNRRMHATAPRALRSAAGLCLLAGLLGGWPPAAASAGCVGPVLGVGPAVADVPGAEPEVVVLQRGAPVTVSGIRFHSGCDDTGQGAGCGAPESEQAPLTGIPLVLEQGATSVVLGTADAAGAQEAYAVEWRVRVPAGLPAGPAVLRAAGAELSLELRP